MSTDVPNALEEVLEKANAISAEKIGVTVDMQFKTEKQFQLDMNTGEYYDMTFSCDWCNDFDGNAMKGYYYDLTELVQSETPALYSAVEPWWEAGSLGGRVYGVPMLKDMGAEVFFRLNSDYFEGEKGLTLPESMDFADLEPLLKMWKEDHPNEYPMWSGTPPLFIPQRSSGPHVRRSGRSACAGRRASGGSWTGPWRLPVRSSSPPTRWTPATSGSWTWALSWSGRNSWRWPTRSPAADRKVGRADLHDRRHDPNGV